MTFSRMNKKRDVQFEKKAKLKLCQDKKKKQNFIFLIFPSKKKIKFQVPKKTLDLH